MGCTIFHTHTEYRAVHYCFDYFNQRPILSTPQASDLAVAFGAFHDRTANGRLARTPRRRSHSGMDPKKPSLIRSANHGVKQSLIHLRASRASQRQVAQRCGVWDCGSTT